MDLEKEGKLTGSFRVPDAVGPIDVEADLRSRLTRASVKMSAPKDGRALTRINWALRQLKNAPADLRVEVQFARTKETTAALLADALKEPKLLLSPTTPKREPRAFSLSLARPLGTKRGRGERSFVLERPGAKSSVSMGTSSRTFEIGKQKRPNSRPRKHRRKARIQDTRLRAPYMRRSHQLRL